MKYIKNNNVYVIRIFKGEEIIETLTRFLKENKIYAGSIMGIGATDDVTLGFFNDHSREYERENIKEALEILSLMGNITKVEESPFCHLHIVLGRKDKSVIGGHLFSARISVTGEIYLTVIDTAIERKFDEETGLKLMNL